MVMHVALMGVGAKFRNSGARLDAKALSRDLGLGLRRFEL